MILVDTSVLIDYLRGTQNAKSMLFDYMNRHDILFCISAFTYQELLQGARDEREFEQLKSYLSTQIICCFPPSVTAYEEAARMYFDLRRQGLTVRSVIDVLIAHTALQREWMLLHNDKDFDVMAGAFENLRILESVEDL